MDKPLYARTLQNHIEGVFKKAGHKPPNLRHGRYGDSDPLALAAVKEHIKSVGDHLKGGGIVPLKVLESGSDYDTWRGISNKDRDKYRAAYKGLLTRINSQAIVTDKMQHGSWKDALDFKELEARPSLLYGAYNKGVIVDGHMIILDKQATEDTYGAYLKRAYKPKEREFALAGDYTLPPSMWPDDPHSVWPNPAQVKLQQVKIIGQSRDGSQTFLSNGDLLVSVNSDYLALVLKYAPDGTIYAYDPKSPVEIKRNGKRFAIVMPMFRQEWPQAIMEAAAKLKANSPLAEKITPKKVEQPGEKVKVVEKELPKLGKTTLHPIVAEVHRHAEEAEAEKPSWEMTQSEFIDWMKRTRSWPRFEPVRRRQR